MATTNKNKNGNGRWMPAIILAVNILVAAGMLATGYSYLIDAAQWPAAAVAGLLFPFFAAADVLLLVLWLIIRWRSAIVPIVALIVCYAPVRMYLSIAPAQKIPDNAIKVISYNVLDFSGMENNRLSWRDNPIVYYLIDTDADVICLQECNRGHLTDEMHGLLEAKYPFHHYAYQGKSGTSLAVYTKHEIIRVDTIPCDTMQVLSLAYTIALPAGYAMVVNNHFESNKFSQEGKNEFRRAMHGKMSRDSVRATTGTILKAYAQAAVKRSAQTKAVEQFLKERTDVPAIVCGDFNDTPVSANVNRIRSGLTDCFRAAGFGFGWTYCHSGMRVRIDNIFCSRHFVPYSCKVLSDTDYSDHRPVVCLLGCRDEAK